MGCGAESNGESCEANLGSPGQNALQPYMRHSLISSLMVCVSVCVCAAEQKRLNLVP